MMNQYGLSLPPKIYAEAIVRSATGESLLRSPKVIDNRTVSLFDAPADVKALAKKRLESAGFEILNVGPVSVNIAAPPEVYERSLKANLEIVQHSVMKDGRQDVAEFVNSADASPLGEIDISRSGWTDILDGVAINDPAYYLQRTIALSEPSGPSEPSDFPPSAFPPETDARYLHVPDDLARELGASLAHAKGVTGKGVKVVVVDSGCDKHHPYFQRLQYNIEVRLGPGSTRAELDANGHGTGVAANVLAIAPDAELTVLKADVALGNKYRNINSAAAFREAVSLNPDIISCSWGSDLRHPKQLSSYHRVLAAAVADAVRRGIVVIFAAGNGQWGFPAQHRDVIAVGGVYKHLEGSLKGKLEASNYASSFISAIYPDRRVPDVCGLVGQLPNAAYIMLPVPKGSAMDRGRSLIGDQTKSHDSWAAFSGTSSAAPQIAGVCALLEQYRPGLPPLKTRHILRVTARDIREGHSNPVSGGQQARAGPDLATGYGLAVIHKAIESVTRLKIGNDQSEYSSGQDLTVRRVHQDSSIDNHFTRFNEHTFLSARNQLMRSEFPKLKANLDTLKWKLDVALREVIKDCELEDVELIISEANFVERSPLTNISSKSRQILESCLDEEGKVKASQIDEQHISSAQVLLSLGRHQETALEVLTEALSLSPEILFDTEEQALAFQIRYDLDNQPPINPKPVITMYKRERKSTDVNAQNWPQLTRTVSNDQFQIIKSKLESIPKKAAEALAKSSTEISKFDVVKRSVTTSLYHGEACLHSPSCNAKVLHEVYRTPDGEFEAHPKPGCKTCGH